MQGQLSVAFKEIDFGGRRDEPSKPCDQLIIVQRSLNLYYKTNSSHLLLMSSSLQNGTSFQQLNFYV